MTFLRDVVFPACVVVATAMTAGVLLDSYEQYRCENYKDIAGKNVRYAHFDACYIETKNGFQRWDEYKARSIASEGLKPE